MNNFVDEMKAAANTKFTSNGGIAKTTTMSSIVDLFGIIGSARNMGENDIINMWNEARRESEILADNMILYTRSIRNGGCGERRIGRLLLKQLAILNPDKVSRNLQKVVDAGRWDDLYSLIDTPVEKHMWAFIKRQMALDIMGCIAQQPISIMAKWLKSTNASSRQTCSLGRITAKKLGMTEKDYRKMLSKLRKYIDVVERKMSAGLWDDINFENVPSVALNRYINSYNKHCAERFEEYKQKVQDGKAKINAATLYPYDIIQKILVNYEWVDQVRMVDDILKLQWNNLPNFLDEPKNVLMVVDTSGSMTCNNYRPLATAMGLGLYFAERNTGAFHNLFMTFSENPSIISLKDSQDFVSKLNTIFSAPWGLNTDLDATFEKVYELSVKADDSPAAICIVSDMQIDEWTNPTLANTLADKWEEKFNEAGLKFPKLIYWNVNSTNTYLGGRNVSYVSGYGINPFKNFTELLEHTPEQAVAKILSKPEFSWN